MKTYIYCGKNNSLTVILSAENLEEAEKLLAEELKEPQYYRLESEPEEEE